MTKIKAKRSSEAWLILLYWNNECGSRRPVSAYEADFTHVTQHALMYQVPVRRGRKRVAQCGFPRLGEALSERRFSPMQRPRQAVCHILRKRSPRQNERPRPYGCDRRVLSWVASRRQRGRLEERVFRHDALDLVSIRRNEA